MAGRLYQALKCAQARVEAAARMGDWNTLRLHEADRHDLLASLGDVELLDRDWQHLLLRMYWFNQWMYSQRPVVDQSAREEVLRMRA